MSGYIVGDKVLTPAGHKATVTEIRDAEANVGIRYDDPRRVPGWFPEHKLELQKEEA